MFSVCLPNNFNSKWIQQAIEYSVYGPSVYNKDVSSYDRCYESVMKTFQDKISVPKEIANKEIYAFSYYFERLFQAKLING